MRRIKHIHSSGRFSRSPESLAAASKSYQNWADLITYTEVDLLARKKALKKAGGDRFETVHGYESHADDCAIQFNKDRFELLHEESFKNSDIVIHRTDGTPRDLPYTKFVVLRDKMRDAILVLGVMHTASDVQAQAQDQSTKFGRVLQWRQSTWNSKRRLNALAKEWKANGRLLIADWNLDFKLLWVRALIKAFAPGYTLTWTNLNVAGGTHGDRIIDATLLRGKIYAAEPAKLRVDDASSDHRPYDEVLAWK